MISISKASKSAVKAFNLKEWHGVDVQHYGKAVEWNSNPFLFKASENGKILGTVSGMHESGVVYVAALIVAEASRGKGVGKMLMDRVAAFGKKLGAHKIHLTTGKDWDANKFYLALGFHYVATLPNHHFHRDFVIYEKLI